MMDQEILLEYVIYAKVNGMATQKFFAKTQIELLQIINGQLREEVDEEIAFQQAKGDENE
jgi:hypothetical protein